MSRPKYVKDVEGTRIFKMDPYSSYWQQCANKEARAYVNIVACEHCGGPRIEFYKCPRCGYE